MPNGEPITIEFLIDEPTFTPHHLPYIKNLGMLGIEATLRIVDPVQYRARVDDFDFDITVERFSFSATPGDSLRTLFLLAGGSDQGLAESRRHRRSGDRRADRHHHRRQDARRNSPPPAGRSTASSAPGATGFRTGTRRRTGSPIGTCSPVPAAKPRYFRGIPETWWYDRDKAGEAGTGDRRVKAGALTRGPE